MILKDIINKHEPVKAACEDTKYTKNTETETEKELRKNSSQHRRGEEKLR